MSDHREESSYYLKIVFMYIDLGTEVVLNTFVYHTPKKDAKMFLDSNDKLKQLRKKKTLNEEECKLVFSQSSSPEDFDISLLIKLSINLFSEEELPPPKKGWAKPPKDSDKSIAADLLRLRTLRNVIVGHRSKARLPQWRFESEWETVREIFLRIYRAIAPDNEKKLKERIDAYKQQRLDPCIENKYDAKLKEWHDEMNKIQDEVEKSIQKLNDFAKYFKSKSDRYERYITLLAKGGRFVLSAFLKEKTKRESLQEHLKRKEDLMRSEITNANHLHVLYPPDHDNKLKAIDTPTWDIPLLGNVILHLFDDQLDELCCHAVRSIVAAHEKYADAAFAALNSDSFEKYSFDLKHGITCLKFHLDEQGKTDCQNILDEYEGVQKGEEAHTTYLEELKAQGTLFKSIADVHKETVRKTTELLQQMMAHGIPFKYDHVVDLKIITHGTVEEKKQMAESVLTEVLQAAQDGSGDICDYPALKKEVEKVLKEMRERSSTNRVHVKQECIILSVVCSTPNEILDLLTFFESTMFRAHLDNISQELGYLFNTVFRLEANLTAESLEDILNDKERESDTTHGVTFPITVSSPVAMVELRSYLKSKTMMSSARAISDHLSKICDDEITVEVSQDRTYLSQPLEDIDVSCSDSSDGSSGTENRIFNFGVSTQSDYKQAYFETNTQTERQTSEASNIYMIRRGHSITKMDDSGSDSDIEECTGIAQPTLLQQIKTILDEYRNDVQIIKELVQNADDAEASEMDILYQGKRTNEHYLDDLKFGKFLRTPALVFHNDAEFSSADWKGIKSIYNSVKKDDPLKIGRFGLGFKSVFHMTDNPCIISGEYILFINPHERNPDIVCTTLKLKALDKMKNRGYVDALMGTFGFSEETVNEGRYQGTLFWFLLRQTPSDLSVNTYAEPEVLTLLQAFINESSKSLLFLKTLCSVKMYINLPKSEGTLPRKGTKIKEIKDSQTLTDLEQMNLGKDAHCYSVTITNDTGNLVVKRSECLRELQELGRSVPRKSMHWTFNVAVKTERKSKTEEVKVTSDRWLIVNCLKGATISERTKELMEDKDLCYLHLVGLAAPINETGDYENDSGQVFCYQPLPYDTSAMTKLPVHLNAFFALSQNRRQIRWPDQDDATHALGDKKIEWNITLVSEMFPEAYQTLVKNLIQVSKREGNPEHLVKAVYNTVPNLEIMEAPWKDLAETYVSECKDDAVFYTGQDNDKWISSEDAVFADFRRFPDIEETCRQTVLELLRTDEVNVITVPEHVNKSFDSKHADIRYITPNFVAKHLKNNNNYKTLTLGQKQDLLEFVSLGLSKESLDGLELIPLANQTFASFSIKAECFLENQDVIDLFPGDKKKFVLADIREKSKKLLSGLADTGKHGVHRLTDNAVAAFLKEMLCDKVNKNKAIQKPLSEATQWKQWIRSIWDLIQSRFKTSLQKFAGLPVFPVVTDYDWIEESQFCLFALESKILHVPSLRKLKDKEQICSSFNHLSVIITEDVPKWLDYNLVRSFLPNDTDEGLVSLFTRISDKDIETFNTESSDAEAAVLLKFVSERIHSDIYDSNQIFQKLKLFQGYTSENDYCRVALNECNKLYIGNHFPVPFVERLIHIACDSEVSFAKRLDIVSLSEFEVVMNTLNNIGNYETTQKQDLMKWIIKEGTHFKNKAVQEQMKHIEFLKAADGNLYQPCDLFDPSDKLLSQLFQDQPVFPFFYDENDNTFFEGLRKLGLKSRDKLKRQDIENVCSVIQKMFVNQNVINSTKCDALYFVMNEKPHLVKKEKIVEYQCIMVKKIECENYPSDVPLKNNMFSTALLCFPSEVKSTEFMHLVGSVLCTVNCKSLPCLCELFGWEIQPTIGTVLEHLSNVVRYFQPENSSAYLNMIIKIYKWLASQQESEIENIMKILKDKFVSLKATCIWVGDGFQATKHVYVEETEGDIDMKPFLHKIPRELCSLSQFFVRIGCRTSLDLDMYRDTLYRIKEESENQGMRVSHSKLRTLAVAILNKINEKYLYELRGNKVDILFPVIHEENESLKMKPTKQCTFCDAQLLQDMDFEIDEDIYYVHPEVPIKTAESLGVPSLRQQMFTNTEAFDEWGQEEPLTRRLRNLLKDGYVDGFSFAKELFQNADDAGANELFILYDERENNDAKTQLISDGMAECQGPAIWVYNDAKFTDEDFKNITQLSGGTKLTDSAKIGKFGLGFCAVYNVTDVPSFVSGNNVVIFDPHMTFLGKTLPGKSPGLRINFEVMKNMKMMKRLKNQFKPFDRVLNCRLTENASPYIDGTLFRLPLRNKASDISDIVYSTSEVKELFMKIKAMAANMLLFNQNVKKLKLLHLPKSEKDPHAMKLLYEAEKERINIRYDAEFSTTILKEVSRRKQGKILAETPFSLIEQATITVQSTLDFQAPLSTDENHLDKTVSRWIVSWSTGCSETSLRLTYDKKGAINLAAVAVPVRLDSTEEGENDKLEIMALSDVSNGFYKTGHLFFFLPLPIEQNFPFHVNGQFAVTTDRRMLQVSTEDDKNMKIKEWNESLLKDPATCALLHLLKRLPNIGLLHKYDFCQLWPRNEGDETLQCLQQSFYQHVARPGIYNVFERDSHWFDISKCVFVENCFRTSSVGDEALELLSLLTQYVIDVPNDIYKLLLDANQKLVQEKTVDEEQFFLEYFLPNFERFQENEVMIEKRNLLLHYAINLKSRSVEERLETTKCIPSQPHGLLYCPRDLVDPVSMLAGLFSASDGRFPANEFSTSHILISLRHLGLMSEVLKDSIVIERARSIQTLHKICPACSTERAGYLFAYLCENVSKHSEIISTLQNISFTPVKCKPADWAFKWRADCQLGNERTVLCSRHSLSSKKMPTVVDFTSASSIYHSYTRNIVGCVALVFEDEIFTVSEKTLTEDKRYHFVKAIGMKGVQVQDVDTEIVIKQLEAIASDGYQIPVTSLQVLRDIYSHLENACGLPKHCGKIEQLRQKPMVNVQETFTYPQNVARKLARDCKPYLYELDSSLLNYCPRLCHCLGIADEFEPSQFVLLVQKIKQRKGEDPLSPSEIYTVINMLTCYAFGMESKRHLDTSTGDKEEVIFGPDENGILRDCKSMCFNDFDGIEKSETMIYMHEDFTPHLAKTLGVQPKAIYKLEENSDDIEDFYQQEPLLTRLQGLIQGYPCDSGIFKELLQNADDANATEIVFLKDFLCHPTNNIVHPSLKPLQGPSLCVFNNSAFSNENLKGIQSLGKGSKSDDPSQTGRYGVGFNAVYNITDAPSFYTKGGDIENGETICFFDPLAKFVPNVTKAKPGKRYKNVSLIKRHHSDMISGYHEQLFLSGQKGTVFRFPLRSVAMAKSSEISQESVDMDTVSKLLDKFCDELREVVLFLKNLETVKVLTHNTNGYEEDYSISIQITAEHQRKKGELNLYSRELYSTMENNRDNVLHFQQKSFAYEISLTEKNREKSRKNKYIIVQTVGFKIENENAIPQDLRNEFLKGKIGLSPHGGIAFHAGDTEVSPENIHREGECKAFCFLPLPINTGLPVHVHGYFCLDHESRRTLWKAESCYRTSWNHALIKLVIAPAYVQFLEYMKEQMFLGTTGRLMPFITLSRIISNYQSMFPVIDNIKDYYWKYLMCCVYKELVMQQIPFLPSQEVTVSGKSYVYSTTKMALLSWTPLESVNCSFPAYIMEESQFYDNSNAKSDFNNILRKIGMRIVFVVETMSRSMKVAEVEILHLCPKGLIKFLCTFNSQIIDKCKIQTGTKLQDSVLSSVRDVTSILRFCLSDKDHLLSCLNQIPLMITQDNVVRTLPETGHFYIEPTGRFCTFFPTKLSVFLQEQVAQLLFQSYEKQICEIRALQLFKLLEFTKLVRETGIIKESKLYQNWDGTNPDKHWIKFFWEFFGYLLPASLPENKTDIVNRELQSLLSLPLIPAIEISSKESFLVPPCDMKRLIDINSFAFSRVLLETLELLNIIQIDDKVAPKASLLKKLVPNNKKPQDVVECLHIYKERLQMNKIKTEQARAVLSFFNDSLDLNDQIPETMQKVMDLSLFESCFNELVAISNYKDRIVLNDDIPNEGLKDIAVKASVLLLKDTCVNRLFKAFGINSVLWTEAYEDFILPNQQQMPRSAFYKHLDFLSRKTWSPDFSRSRIVSMLRNAPFIETVDNKLVKASELFDPSHAVFKNMCEKCELVPECLRGSYILELLRLVGLKDKMTINLFEMFARKVEAIGCHKVLSKEISKQSKLLVSHLLQMKEEFFYNEDFNQLRKIKFLIPHVVDEELTAIHYSLNCQRLICFEQSVLKSSQHIAWTVSSILPEEADPTKQNPALASTIIKKLEICRELDIHKLIQHCVNTGKGLSSKMNCNQGLSYQTVSAVMTAIYKVLDDYRVCGKLTEETVKPLENVPMIYYMETKTIHVATRVVNACRDEEEIQPYLNKSPSSLAQFQDLFLLLGAKREPTCEVFISVLNAIKLQSGCTAMLPKERSDSRKAMGQLFKYIVQQTTEIKVAEKHVHLLSENETLDPAQNLVLANNIYYQKQLERNATKQISFLFPPEKLQGCRLKLEACADSLQYLPQKHRPFLLSDLVKERINLANIVHKDRKFAIELETFFQSRYFVNGFLRLIRHAYKSNNLCWNDAEENRLIRLLENVRFQHVSGIKTTLALVSVKDGELCAESPIENTDEAKSVHLEIDPEKVCIFFDMSDGKWFSTLTKQFTVYLNGIASKCLKVESFVILMDIIGMKDSPEKISLLLSKEKIEEYQTTVEINEIPVYPIPGTFVPKCLHQYLDNDYGAIQEYDYKFIALEVDDPSLIDVDETEDDVEANTDKTSDEIRNNGNESDDDVKHNTDPTYIFIHITKKIERTGELALLQEYEIDDGSENLRVVRAYQLYKFVRKRETQSDITNAVMVYNSASTSNSNRSSTQTNSISLEEAFNEVKEYLREAWKKTETERRKIVKRLLLKWHPDKNPDNVSFCTKVFQYIQQCLDRLDKGQDLIDDDVTDTPNWSSSWYGRYWKRYGGGRRNSWRSNKSNHNFDDYWSSKRTSHTHTDTDEEPYHWYSEARRWMRQAYSDLKNAESSVTDMTKHSGNWICYKAHQAAEKSLKAAWYAENANKIRKVKYSHNVSSLAIGLSSDIVQLANRLSVEVGDHSRMRYPDMYAGQEIPAEAYTRETTQRVIHIAQEILSLVQRNHIK